MTPCTFRWEDGNGLHSCRKSGAHEVHKCTCGSWWPINTPAVFSGEYDARELILGDLPAMVVDVPTRDTTDTLVRLHLRTVRSRARVILQAS